MTRHEIKKRIITLFLLLPFTLLFAQTNSELEKYVHLDLPIGYKYVSGNNISCTFKHSIYPVTTELKLLPYEDYKNSGDALSSTLTKIKAKHSLDSFIWNKKDCSISQISLTLDEKYEGWAITCATPDKKYYIFMIGYVVDYLSKGFSPYILSGINSLWIDAKDYYSEGIIMTYAFPKEGEQEINFVFDNKNVKSKMDKSDCEAAQYLIELEYKIYGRSMANEYKKEARQRFYRMIYRDNYARVRSIIDDIYKKYNPRNQKLTEKKQLEFTQKALSWVQSFDYVRATSIDDSDIVCLPSFFMGKGNDCDSRCLMLCTFIQYIGLDSVLLVSDEFKHAIVGMNFDAPGQKFNIENVDYLLGETTANVTWGTIVKDHAVPSKWDHIYLY